MMNQFEWRIFAVIMQMIVCILIVVFILESDVRMHEFRHFCWPPHCFISIMSNIVCACTYHTKCLFEWGLGASMNVTQVEKVKQNVVGGKRLDEWCALWKWEKDQRRGLYFKCIHNSNVHSFLLLMFLFILDLHFCSFHCQELNFLFTQKGGGQ